MVVAGAAPAVASVRFDKYMSAAVTIQYYSLTSHMRSMCPILQCTKWRINENKKYK